MRTQGQIETKIREQLLPTHLEVTNESAKHNVPPGSESHFKLVVVSAKFDGKSLLERHREVYGLLKTEMNEGIHALALHTFSPAEWDKQIAVQKSPACLGGSKK